MKGFPYHKEFKVKVRDISIGEALVPYDYDRKCWALPGRRMTRDENVAYDTAFKIHDLIKAAK